MDPMSGFDIRLVFTLRPRDSTLQYKRCEHLHNNHKIIKIIKPHITKFEYNLQLDILYSESQICEYIDRHKFFDNSEGTLFIFNSKQINFLEI